MVEIKEHLDHGRKKDYLAIEIGASVIKAAYIKSRNGGTDVVDLAVEDISGLSVSDVSQKLSDMVKSMEGVKNPEVINVIPSGYTIFKNIEIPSVDEKEIKSIIDLQAGRHTPYSREEIILDHLNLGRVHESYTKVLLVIVKKDIITDRYDMIKEAGFKAKRAVLSSEVVSRYFEIAYPDESLDTPVALVNIDKDALDFIVTQGGDCLYIRSVPVANINRFKDEEDVKNVFFEGLKSSVESYLSEGIDSAPEKIFFTGATRSITGMEAEIEGQLGLEPVIVSEFKMLGIPEAGGIFGSIDKSVSLLSVIAPQLVVEDLELQMVPEEVKIKQNIKERARLSAKIGILAMAAVAIFVGIFLVNLAFKKIFIESLESKYTEEVAEVVQLKLTSERANVVQSF